MKKRVNRWSLRLSLNHWSRTSRVSVCGHAFNADGKFLTGIELCEYFDVHNTQIFIERLKACNGLFSVICHSEEFNAAAVSPSRIYPLYYRKSEDRLLISDNPYLLVQRGDVLNLDSLKEYEAAGYPLNGKTLLQGIQQVLPGGIFLDDSSTKKYYSYLSCNSELVKPDNKQMSTMLNNVFERMLSSIQGRQIVVPLSGGNDSRLILCMLRRLHYDNVICYTVGRTNNPEEKIAKKVAEQLGYPLYVIDTTQKDFAEYVSLDNDEFCRYCRFIGGMTNFMWLFEYVAIMWLKKENVLSDEAVFVPGHAADFNAGSHLMKACMAPNSSAIYSANAIAFDNFEYGCHQNVWYKIYQHFSTYKKINNDVPNWSIFQDFVFSNRLPYNVNNSARVYQFFNYDIRLPYWDYEFLEFFRRMPWDELYRCGFYTHFIREYIFKEMNVDFSREYPSDQYYFRMKLRKRLVRLLPDCVRNKVKKSDVLGEVILSKPMFDELCQKKLYKETAKCSANQIMKDWYLLKIREMLLQI